MELFAKYFVRFALVLCLYHGTCDAARHVNITHFDNCEEFGKTVPMYFTDVSHWVDNATGVFNTVHGNLNVTIPSMAGIYAMTISKCGQNTTGACTSNSVVVEEPIDCERFRHDDSGPWHMFSSSNANSTCFEKAGIYSIDYTSLKLEHLVRYLDIHDDEFPRFRIRIHFITPKTRQTLACFNMDFYILKTTVVRL